MTIQAITQPYEILIRFTDGQVSGAHYKTIEVVTDGARVYSATEGQPEPLEGDAVAAVLGETLQSSLLRCSTLEAELSEQAALITELNEQLSAALQQLSAQNSH
jgi:hypothetical protein